MKYKGIADKIIGLKDADFELREWLIENKLLGQGYHPKMAQLHDQNAEILGNIMDEIGYPTVEKVGEAASEAAWLVIQHSIGQPDFMRKCADLLENAVAKNQANPQNLAFLQDRIAVFEGKPQRYGTQFDWNENGELVPAHFDDLDLVNQRRKRLGLATLQEQTHALRKRAKAEHENPPVDFEARKKEMDNWRKSVGWIK